MTLLSAATVTPQDPALRRPRLGFLGVGWIGRNRLEAVTASGVAEVAAVADLAEETACAAAPLGAAVTGAAELFDRELDGLVIATPSALHAEQVIAALERKLAVFCQKPLARTAAEARAVVDAARAADRLLGVDLSYRYTEAMQQVRGLVQRGELGPIYAADLVFHNAYGPDKAWAKNPRLAGGGCLIYLGVHLVDLALWVLETSVVGATGRLFAAGEPLRDGTHCEDYAEARLDLASGATVRLACSWGLAAGRDAVIRVTFHGTRGSAAMSNVHGSFYDFVAERCTGTARTVLATPPDAWGGRAIVDWARRLAAGAGFDPAAERNIEVAAALDAIYGR